MGATGSGPGMPSIWAAKAAPTCACGAADAATPGTLGATAAAPSAPGTGMGTIAVPGALPKPPLSPPPAGDGERWRELPLPFRRGRGADRELLLLLDAPRKTFRSSSVPFRLEAELDVELALSAFSSPAASLSAAGCSSAGGFSSAGGLRGEEADLFDFFSAADLRGSEADLAEAFSAARLREDLRCDDEDFAGDSDLARTEEEDGAGLLDSSGDLSSRRRRRLSPSFRDSLPFFLSFVFVFARSLSFSFFSRSRSSSFWRSCLADELLFFSRLRFLPRDRDRSLVEDLRRRRLEEVPRPMLPVPRAAA